MNIDRGRDASHNGMLDGMPQVAIRISEQELDFLDRIVAEGRFDSRAAAVRAGLAALAKEEQDQAIARSYREAYGQHPPDGWFAEAAADLLDGRLARTADQADRR